MTGRNRWLTAFAVVDLRCSCSPRSSSSSSSRSTTRSANFVWKGFTLDWYPTVFANDELLDALFVTLQVAAVAVLVSTVLGTLLGPGAGPSPVPGQDRDRDAAARADGHARDRDGPEPAHLLLPARSTDAAASGRSSIAHITFCISYVAIVVRARAVGMDPRLEEAARDLGRDGPRGVPLRHAAAHRAGRHQRGAARLRPVVRRLHRHDVQRRASGRRRCRCTSTARSSSGSRPEINAISTIIVAVTAVVILAAWRINARRDAQTQAALAAG